MGQEWVWLHVGTCCSISRYFVGKKAMFDSEFKKGQCVSTDKRDHNLCKIWYCSSVLHNTNNVSLNVN